MELTERFFQNSAAVLVWLRNAIGSLFAKAPVLFAVLGLYFLLALVVAILRNFISPP